ncbi:MAG TPA: NAD-dependent epimerase/dehydratase family protein [Gammaproteobacteria bacterium]|nr:NAD-dependent epimerase/dehydratase family protein [Gammaproteobacteria bacterium]
MKSVKDFNIVLIGGAGFIGHNLAITLSQLGAKVDIIDSLQVNNLYSFGNALTSSGNLNKELYLDMINERLDLIRRSDISLHLQDARDYHALSRMLSEIKPDIVIQLAAVSHANQSNKDPYSTFDHSLRTLENALDASRGMVKHFIYFSSSMVYGHFDGAVVTEETICNPLGIYGALKYSGEKIVIAYNQVFNLPYTIIRPSALYGERCVSRRVGQIFLENAIQGKDVVINGDGSDSLDFTYIQDLIQGVIKVIENDNAINQTFNITYGECRQIRDMATLIKAYFPNINIKYVPKDMLTPDRGTLSVDKARRLIAYEPQYPLEKGYKKYIEWYQSSKRVGHVA